jgi:hypothetical protein
LKDRGILGEPKKSQVIGNTIRKDTGFRVGPLIKRGPDPRRFPEKLINALGPLDLEDVWKQDVVGQVPPNRLVVDDGWNTESLEILPWSDAGEQQDLRSVYRSCG